MTTNDVDALYVRGQIDHKTWLEAQRQLRHRTIDASSDVLRLCQQLHACAKHHVRDAARLKARREAP